MNNKAFVKVSNILGITSIILLVYWVFAFISITVFGFRVFKENITETFYLSIMGILALMLGSLIINVMLNLTRIAEKHNQDEQATSKRKNKKIGLLFIAAFPIIFLVLAFGDYLNSSKKEKMMVSTAKSIVESNTEKSDKLLEYSFDENWILQTDDILDLYSRTDRSFPNVSVIVADTISRYPVYLSFRNYEGELNDTIQPAKKDFIYETTKEERDYLNDVFQKKSDAIRFKANDGEYQLFFPYIKNGRRIVLYFSQYQRYGKIGS